MGMTRGDNSEVLDNVRRMFQSVHAYAKSAECATGLTGPQLWAVKLLARDAPMRVSDLARQMYLRPPTVVRILDRIEIKGVITRTPSRKDRRAVDVQLTDTGRELAAKAPEVAQTMLLQGLDALTDEQFRYVDEGMKLLVQMLGAELLTPQPLHG